MTRELKHHLESFDVDLLSDSEIVKFNYFKESMPKRLALLELIKSVKFKSYYLEELKELINLQEINIRYYE